MPTGDDVFRDLQGAWQTQRRQATEAERAQQALEADSRQLVSDRGNAVLELARHYLPDLTQVRVASTFAEIRSDLQRIVDRQERQQQQLSGQRDRLREKVQALEARLEQVTAELTRQVAERERLAKDVAQRLTADTQFQQSSQQLLDAEAKLALDQQRCDELKADAKQKLPAYQRSSLFQYLLNRGYGRPTYKSKGLIRQLDRWVAGLINFPQSLRGYEFLSEAPALVQQEVERRKAALVPLFTQVQQMQRKVADETGLTGVLEQGTQLGKQRDELVHQVGEQRTLLQQVEQELIQLTRTESPFYEEALTRFRQFLEGTQGSVLAAWAATTPSPHDDELVAQIQSLTAEIDRLRPELERQTQVEAQLERHSHDLEFLVRRFQQANFDAPRSRFGKNLELVALLDQLARGVLSKESVWEKVKDAQEFEPTWAEESMRSRGYGASSGDLWSHPVTQVLMHAAVEVAGAAIQAAANQSSRRSEDNSSSWPSSPISFGPTMSHHLPPSPPSAPPAPPPAAPSPRGFTTGDGF